MKMILNIILPLFLIGCGAGEDLTIDEVQHEIEDTITSDSVPESLAKSTLKYLAETNDLINSTDDEQVKKELISSVNLFRENLIKAEKKVNQEDYLATIRKALKEAKSSLRILKARVLGLKVSNRKLKGLNRRYKDSIKIVNEINETLSDSIAAEKGKLRINALKVEAFRIVPIFGGFKQTKKASRADFIVATFFVQENEYRESEMITISLRINSLINRSNKREVTRELFYDGREQTVEIEMTFNEELKKGERLITVTIEDNDSKQVSLILE